MPRRSALAGWWRGLLPRSINPHGRWTPCVCRRSVRAVVSVILGSERNEGVPARVARRRPSFLPLAPLCQVRVVARPGGTRRARGWASSRSIWTAGQAAHQPYQQSGPRSIFGSSGVWPKRLDGFGFLPLCQVRGVAGRGGPGAGPVAGPSGQRNKCTSLTNNPLHEASEGPQESGQSG